MSNQLLTEQQVKDVLGIKDFRNVSKEKVIQLASILPNLDKEVALKIVEQFPDFANFATTIIEHFKTMFDSTLESNKESMQKPFEAYNAILEEFLEQIKTEGISQEDKRYFAEKAIEIADKISEKDTENKSFLLNLLKAGAAVGATALAVAFVILGGKLNKD